MDSIRTLLTFYGDSQRWHNVVRLPAYPSGYSYPRAFRYRDAWIEPALLQRVRGAGKKLDGETVALGIRFVDQGRHHRFLPVREGTITHASPSGDTNQIHFRLGSFFAPILSAPRLDDVLVDVPKASWSATDDRLFFLRHGIEIPTELVPQEDEEAAWANYTTLMATADAIHADARNAVYIRLRTPRRRRSARIGQVAKSWEQGRTFGPVLAESTRYEMAVLQRIPALVGTATTLPAGLGLELTSSSPQVEVFPRESVITSTYDTHTAWVTPSDRGILAEVKVESSDPSTAAISDAVPVPVEFLLSSRLGFFRRLWGNLLPMGAVFGALVASAYLTSYGSYHKHPLSFQWVVLLYAFASFVLFVFKR